jgi:CheY-like chemotaxis protein
MVVDDALVDRVLVETVLVESGFEVVCVPSGPAALARLREESFDVVVTDLVMPVMDGFELVGRIHEDHADTPVILMTSRGSEEIAVRALQAGAASYVPKRILREHLPETVTDVVALLRDQHAAQEVFSALHRSESEFELGNDLRVLRSLVRHLQEATHRIGVCGEGESRQVGMALQEAVHNAAEHGNLEVSSDLREENLAGYHALLEARAGEPPYRDRRIRVQARLDREHATFRIRDEGPGFDPNSLPDPRDPQNLEKLSGRGVLLMRTFMDEVRFNDRGNEVVLVKRRP